MCVTQREARDDFLDESQKVSNADEHNRIIQKNQAIHMT